MQKLYLNQPKNTLTENPKYKIIKAILTASAINPIALALFAPGHIFKAVRNMNPAKKE